MHCSSHDCYCKFQEVEREISFRTEAGLYYSFFKQIVEAPSFSQGLYDLTHDNVTEHLRTINILERFNIYQEVILGALYKVSPIKVGFTLILTALSRKGINYDPDTS